MGAAGSARWLSSLARGDISPSSLWLGLASSAGELNFWVNFDKIWCLFTNFGEFSKNSPGDDRNGTEVPADQQSSSAATQHP